jgi:hypothetical protein
MVTVRQISSSTALSSILAFWAGMVLAAQRYPSEYDWRYMPISHLLSPARDPAGYLWAWTGIVLCSLFGLCWTALLSRQWKQEAGEDRPKGIGALQFGYAFAIGAGVLPQWIYRIERGHEILTILAFGGICVGMISLMFTVINRTLMGRLLRLTAKARLLAGTLASAAVFPIVLAAFAQAYVHFTHPELRWVNLSWRDRGVPMYLSFNFWEWTTCVVLSGYIVILSLTTETVYSPRKSDET